MCCCDVGVYAFFCSGVCVSAGFVVYLLLLNSVSILSLGVCLYIVSLCRGCDVCFSIFNIHMNAPFKYGFFWNTYCYNYYCFKNKHV